MTSGRVQVRVTPRGGRDAVVGTRDDVVLIRVSAPPADGRANEAVCRLVASVARVAPSRVAVVRGHRSRSKIVEVDGLDDTALWRALAPAGPDQA